MRTKKVALILLTLTLATSALHMKAAIICGKHVAFLTDKTKVSIKSIKYQMAITYRCRPKVIHFFKVEASPYMVNVNGTWYGWQTDGEHVGALGVTLQPGAPVEVAVIDTGLAPGANVNADWNNARAFTSLVDDLAASGVCSDYGIANLFNATNIKIEIPLFTIVITSPYQFPYNQTIYKYCVIPNTDVDGDGTPDTVIVVQLTEPYDIVGHGTFVSSVINGFLTTYNGTEYVTGVVTNETYPYLKVVPIKADVIYLVAFDKTCTTLAQCLNATLVPSLYIYGGMFDDYSLANATQYVATLAQTAPVKVVNMSLGGWYDVSDYSDFVNFCQETIGVLNSAGVIPIVAAGNEHEALDPSVGYEWPAMCEGAYPVSALTVDNKLASFSNYGSVIAFSAPGDSVAGIYPAFSLIYEEETLVGAAQKITNDTSGDYVLVYDSGTSYASPIAAAVVALAISQGKGLYSVMNGARDVPPILGYDVYYGWGEVYLPGALSAPNVPPSVENAENDLQAPTIAASATSTISFTYYPSSSTTLTNSSIYAQNRVPFVGLLAAPLLRLLRRSKKSKKATVAIVTIIIITYATKVVHASLTVKVVEPERLPITVQSTVNEIGTSEFPDQWVSEVASTSYDNGIAVALVLQGQSSEQTKEVVIYADGNGNVRKILEIPLNGTYITRIQLGVYRGYLVYISNAEAYVLNNGVLYITNKAMRMSLLDKYGHVILNATRGDEVTVGYGEDAYDEIRSYLDAQGYLNGTLGMVSLGWSGPYSFLVYVSDFPSLSNVTAYMLNSTSDSSYVLRAAFKNGNDIIVVGEVRSSSSSNTALNVATIDLSTGKIVRMIYVRSSIPTIEDVMYCPSSDRMILTLLNYTTSEYDTLVIRNVTQGTPSALMIKGAGVVATYKCQKALANIVTQYINGYASYIQGILDLDTGKYVELCCMPWMEKAVFLDKDTLLGFAYYGDNIEGRFYVRFYKVSLAETQSGSTLATSSGGSVPSVSLVAVALARLVRRLRRPRQRK